MSSQADAPRIIQESWANGPGSCNCFRAVSFRVARFTFPIWRADSRSFPWSASDIEGTGLSYTGRVKRGKAQESLIDCSTRMSAQDPTGYRRPIGGPSQVS